MYSFMSLALGKMVHSQSPTLKLVNNSLLFRTVRLRGFASKWKNGNAGKFMYYISLYIYQDTRNLC